MREISELSREDLLKLLEIYAKSWSAHDGCWFLAAEEKYGIETAMMLDAESWARFAPIEAERIKSAFGIPESGGIPALEQALKLRMYALANRQEIVRIQRRRLELRMIECRVQQARRRKGLRDFPCKQVSVTRLPGICAGNRPGDPDGMPRLPSGSGWRRLLQMEIYKKGTESMKHFRSFKIAAHWDAASAAACGRDARAPSGFGGRNPALVHGVVRRRDKAGRG